MPLPYSRRPTLYLAVLAFSVAALFLGFATARTSASGARIDSKLKLQAHQAAAQGEAAWQTRLRELDEKLRNPRLLLLRNAEFDPLAGEPAPLRIGPTQLETTSLSARASRLAARAGQQAESQAAYFIVQYPDRIAPQWTDSLRASGYEIAGYLANNAYIVKAPRGRESQLLAARSRGDFRWVGAYGSGLKVESELAHMADGLASGALTRADLDNPETVAVSFLTFRGENAAAARQAVNQFNLAAEPIIEERNDGRAWGVACVAPEQLPSLVTALASVEGIEWIERRRPHRAQNNNGVRVVQSGIVGNDAPLYRNGLTGAGQIYGTADSGLDDDHAQFKFDGQASSQTLSFAITSQSLVNGLLPINITNPNNKVLAYYLLGSGNLIDNAANPNGGKTLDPTQKVGTGANASYFNAVAYDDDEGAGVYHGTHTTSIAVGRDFNADGSGALPGIPLRTSGDGVAPDARLVFQDVGHPSGQLPGVDNISQALIHEQAYASGVRVHNNSYGPPPITIPYDQDAADIDDVMWRLRDYNIFFSGGNDDAGTMKVTNVAKNNIVVGATESPTSGGNVENLADYSNHGPTLDGRIKPDIAAPGSVIAATESTGVLVSAQLQFGSNLHTSSTALDAAVNGVGPDNNRSLSGFDGTSFSSPMVAGGALLVRQYFTDGYYPSGARNAANGFTPSNALVKAIILNSGRNMTGGFTANDGTGGARGPLPNSGQGWGRIALDDALYFTGDRRELKVLADVYNGATTVDGTRPAPNAAIMTGQTQTYQLTNVSTIEPLRITLVWSDPNASVGAQTALVNNLDLEVTDPQGAVYRGNVNFANAYSQPAGSAASDNKNPLEAVYIQYPVPGTYTVRVIGANVPGNGQMQILAQPGNQLIDSNRQGYALIATGNFTAGAQPVLNLNVAMVTAGATSDLYISRNQTVTAAVAVADPTVVAASSVNVQVAVDAASQVPANLVRINGQPAGQAASLNYGSIASGGSKALAFQITLLDDGVNRTGQAINFNATITPANGPPITTSFVLIVNRKIIVYRTRFEPTADPGGNGVIVIPESAWGLRPDNPNPAPTGNLFAGPWQLTTSKHSDNNGSTASLGDPSSPGVSYGASSVSHSDGIYDESRWWTTQKIVLPGLIINPSTGKVSNPELAAQLNTAIDSFDVDINADFAGDSSSGNQTDFAILRVRPYQNTVPVTALDDSGFDSNSFTNLMFIDSTSGSTNGFTHFSGKPFVSGFTGVFAVNNAAPDNSDVAFRLELHFRRNSVAQTGDGVFFDNLVVRLRVDDVNVYAAPASAQSVSVDAASFARVVAPGQILSVFGSGFPASTNLTASAQTIPLPPQLGNVSVRVNGFLAPLFFVGVGGGFGAGAFQINYQLPYETTSGIAFVEVLNNGVPVTSEFLTVNDAGPGVFTTTANGVGQAVAVNQDFSLNGNPSQIAGARPEARGRVVQVFANGQGGQFVDFTTRQPLQLASGVAATFSPLYATAATPTITIGNIPATVNFSGMTPGLVGLWQLNVVIPPNAPTGNAVPLVVTLNGQTGLTTTIAVN